MKMERDLMTRDVVEENYYKRDDAIHCDKYGGLLVEKSDFQIGWHSGNRKSLEPSNAVLTWVHMDLRSFSKKFLPEIYFITTEQELGSKDL
jgi:hypothetical protein